MVHFPINLCVVEDSVENYQSYLISCCAFKVFESFGSFSFFRFVTQYDIISISLMIFMLNYAFTHILFSLRILCSSVEMSNRQAFNNRNLFLTAKLLKQVYRYHKIQKAFSRFYHRHSELIV